MSGRGVLVSIEIDASPEQVWAELERIEDHVEWMADAVAIDFHGEQRRGSGTSFSCRTRIGPLATTDEMEIIEWEPPRSMGVTHRGAVTGTGRFEIEPMGDGSLVSWNERLRFPAWMGGPLGAAVAGPIFKWIWRRNLVRLKARVEGGDRR